MPIRVLTVFRGPALETRHDTDTGRITTPGGHSLPCTLAQFLRSASREARVHRELGWPYRVAQSIEEEEDALSDTHASARLLIEQLGKEITDAANELAAVRKMAKRCEPLTGPDLDEMHVQVRDLRAHADKAAAWLRDHPPVQTPPLHLAAPKLLAACELLVEAYDIAEESGSVSWTDLDACNAAARGAIHAARGTTEAPDEAEG